MSYEYGGSIKIIDKGGYPEAKQLLQDAADKCFKEEAASEEEYTEFIENMFMHSVDIYGSGGYDEVDSWDTFFICVCDNIISLSLDCEFDAYFFGTADATGTCYGMRKLYKNGQAICINCEMEESKFVKCPKCEWDAGPGFDRIEFGEEHECTECGYTLSGEEVVDSLIEQGVIYLQKYNNDGTEAECIYEDKGLLKKMVLEML